MTTATLPAPNRPTGGVTPHGVEPSPLLTALGLSFLLVGFFVDLAAFRAALAVVATDLGDRQVDLLAAAAGLMALFLMFEAGYVESERRETTMGSHGKGIVRTLQGIWLLAGVAATFIRLTAEPETTTDVFGEPAGAAGVAAGGTDPFGAPLGDPLGAAPAGGIDLGFATIYPEHIPVALFMLVLYLGVGVGAYLFGRRFYRPLLTDLRRKRKALKQQSKALAKLRKERDEAVVRAAELRRAADEIAAHHGEIASLRSMESALVTHEEAVDRLRSTASQRLATEQAEARIAASLGAIEGQALTESSSAQATGRAAEQHARTLLHEHLADPARTVMDGDVRPPNQPNTLEP